MLDLSSPAVAAALVGGSFVLVAALLNLLSGVSVAQIQKKTQREIEHIKIQGARELERQASLRLHRAELVKPISTLARERPREYRELFDAVQRGTADGARDVLREMLARRNDLTRDETYLGASDRDYTDLARHFLDGDERCLGIVADLLAADDLGEIQRRERFLYTDICHDVVTVLKAAEAFVFGERVPYDPPSFPDDPEFMREYFRAYGYLRNQEPGHTGTAKRQLPDQVAADERPSR
jgi:hypothetical protein